MNQSFVHAKDERPIYQQRKHLQFFFRNIDKEISTEKYRQRNIDKEISTKKYPQRNINKEILTKK